MTRILQIALDKDGVLKSIYEVKTGKDCDCFCPECNSPLEAKNRNKLSNESLSEGQRIAHFAHYDGSICSSAPETAIHLLAKKVLAESKTLLIPSLFWKDVKLINEQKITFDKVEVEKEIKSDTIKVKPDIILHKDGKELLVEFFKTHQVDSEKIHKIKSLNKSCIEININSIDPLINGELNIKGLIYVFENDASIMYWIYNSKEHYLIEKENQRLRKLELENQKLRKLDEEHKIKELEIIRIAKEEKIEGIKAWKAGLLLKGYDFIKVYEFIRYSYDSHFNEYTGRSKTYKHFESKDENVYCPKHKENGKNKRIDLTDCLGCEFHHRITFEEAFIKYVVCGFKNKLKGK